jgi:hypothetical protein
MRRREVLGVVGGALAWPLAARAQPTRMVTIGVLTLINPNPEPLLKALREGLRGAGYVEGRNLRLEVRVAAAKADLQLEKAAELVRLKVDLIVTFFTPSALAATALSTIASNNSWPSLQISITCMRYILSRRESWLALSYPQRILLKSLGCATFSKKYSDTLLCYGVKLAWHANPFPQGLSALHYPPRRHHRQKPPRRPARKCLKAVVPVVPRDDVVLGIEVAGYAFGCPRNETCPLER